jgi:hypothetical protein
MFDLFDNVWGRKDKIRVDHCADITVQARPYCPEIPASYKLTYFQRLPWLSLGPQARLSGFLFPKQYSRLSYLLAFGRRVTLIDDLIVPEGHKLTFKDALRIVATGTPTKIIFPNWMMNLTTGLARVQLGFDELKVNH